MDLISLGDYLGFWVGGRLGAILQKFLAEALRIGPATPMQPHPHSHLSESVDKKSSAAGEG